MTGLRAAQLAQLAGRKPALVVVDVQRDFGDPECLGGYQLSPGALASVAVAVERTGELVTTARSINIPVVWVELGSDPARPWRASNWLRAGDYDAPMAPNEPCVIGSPGASWYKMAPQPGELRVVKRGYSGFLGTDLEERLHAAGLGWLTVTGLTSECCVAATATDAMQLDWPVVIPRDATAAYDLAVHEAALAQLALNVAVLSDCGEVVSLWKEASAS